MAKNNLSYHDKYTRSMMTNPKVIHEFFQKNLPDHVREVIDFSSIQFYKESLIDDSLKSQIVDLLYKADFSGKPGFLYLMIEHASTSHHFLAFRLLKYMMGIMEEHLRSSKTKELPLVYPIVFYTGKRPYNHSLDLFDLFPEQERELARQTLFSPYHLIDLTQNSDKELSEFLWYGPMARLLKHIHDADILPFFKSIMDNLKFLAAQEGEWYIKIMMTYMAKAGETPYQEELFKAAMEIETKAEDKLMTLADYIEERIGQENHQRGQLESKREIARNMLSMGMDLNIISSATGLSSQEIKGLAH
jgi:predicted transposase/invertase (TIGR01784 family)